MNGVLTDQGAVLLFLPFLLPLCALVVDRPLQLLFQFVVRLHEQCLGSLDHHLTGR